MAGDINYNSVDILLPCDGTNGSTTFTDASNNARTVTANGNAQISTAQSKFGGASALFDGTGDYLSYTGGSFNIRTGTWSIEMWARPNGVSDQVFLASPGGSFYIQLVGGTFYVGDGATNTISAASPGFTTNTWSWLVVTFDGTTYKVFVDGVSKATSTTLLNNTNITSVNIGYRSNTVTYYNGYIDDFRLTIGVVRDGTQVPTAALPTRLPQFTGNITESLAITDWRVHAVECATGVAYGTATSSGASYTLGVTTYQLCVITIHPKIDYAWSAGKVVALNDYCVPVNPDTTQRLFKATNIGSSPNKTHATTEPTWPSSGTVVDNDITWTYIADLVDPIALGPKIPS